MKNHENKVKKQIKEFISKKFLFIGKEEEKTIGYHLARIIGNKNDILITLEKNEGFVGFDSYGNIVSIDDRIIYICGWK